VIRGAVQPDAAGWASQARALFLKDVRAELRTRVALSSVGLFTFAALLLIALATRVLKETLTVDLARLPEAVTSEQIRAHMLPAWDDPGKMGLLWVLLIFSAFAGLAHSFVHEEEAGTTLALRLSMAPGAVYAGKLCFNLAVVLCVAAIATPAYVLITGLHTGPIAEFLVLMIAGCLGLGAVATIVAALAAKARGTGGLFGALGLPLLIVFELMLLNAANTLYGGDVTPLQSIKDFGGLISYSVLLIAVSAVTFHFVWEE